MNDFEHRARKGFNSDNKSRIQAWLYILGTLDHNTEIYKGKEDKCPEIDEEIISKDVPRSLSSFYDDNNTRVTKIIYNKRKRSRKSFPLLFSIILQ